MKNKVFSVIFIVLAMVSLILSLVLFFNGTYEKHIWALNTTIVSFILVPIFSTIGIKLFLIKNKE